MQALVLTHGHEDHIGARARTCCPSSTGPVYGTRLALALVEPKLEEHGIEHGPGLHAVGPRDRVTIGPFTLEFIRVTHSMPDCVAVAIHTPQGVLLHTGDFKIDQTPLDGEAFDLPRFAQLGAEGVLALMCDSTNVDRRGFTGSERDVQDAFEELFTGTEGRLVVATFSSSLYRLQMLVDLAAAFDRKVAFVGRGMIENSQVAQRLGHLHLPTGVVIKDSDVAELPGAGRPLPGDGIAGRTERGALADRHRRSPARAPERSRSRGALRARHPGQREGHRPRAQPPGPARRGGRDRIGQARARLGPRRRARS